MADLNHFYLEEIIPNPESVFSTIKTSPDDLAKNAIVVFDTNALLVPFLTSKENLGVIEKLLSKLKEEGRLFIPARVAREFGRNRGKKMAEIFTSLRQLKSKMDTSNFVIQDYPILHGIEEYDALKKNYDVIKSAINEHKKNIEKLEKKIAGWSMNDNVSKAYETVFTADIIIACEKDRGELIKDLKFRIEHKIAPGYKDAAKPDEGIGDLIIWQTILELGEKHKKDIIFITNEEKNDWFVKGDNQALYPKYELIDAYRRISDGKHFAAKSFVDFLTTFKIPEETVTEVKKVIQENIGVEEQAVREDDLREARNIRMQELLKKFKNRLSELEGQPQLVPFGEGSEKFIGRKVSHPQFGIGIIFDKSLSAIYSGGFLRSWDGKATIED